MSPPSSKLAAWKAEFGEVYSVEIRKQTVVFRALNFEELRYISSSQSTASFVDLEDYCVQHALLYPELDFIEGLPAGAYSSLAKEIREASGLGDAKAAIEALDRARDECNNVINVAKVYILATMPSYSEEDLEHLTATQLFHKVALAERIIELQQQIFAGSQLTFTIIDPEEEEKKMAEKERTAKERLEFMRKNGMQPSPYEEMPDVQPRIKTDDPIAAKLLRRR